MSRSAAHCAETVSLLDELAALDWQYDAMPKVTWKGVEARRFRHQLYGMHPLYAAQEYELGYQLEFFSKYHQGRLT